MSCTYYQNQELYIEQCSLKNIAREYGTPTYIYSKEKILNNWQAFSKAFKPISHLICYAVKANSNISLLNLFAQQNAGFDIVSIGELHRVIFAKGKAERTIFSGVGKTATEIEQAIDLNIYCFDVESIAELERIQTIAQQKNKTVGIALRVNPHVEPKTHEYIATGMKENKFGIDLSEVLSVTEELKSMPNLQLIGIACHIGSQITELKPFAIAADRMIELYHALIKKGFDLRHINMGGGLGIIYHHEQPPSFTDYANMLIKKMKSLPVQLILEPGRALIADAGILMTRVEYLKHNQYKNFAIVDAGMNDFIRPALYQAWQPIHSVMYKSGTTTLYDIAGPVCESADIFAKDRSLQLEPGDLLSLGCVGAYGFSMSSNYNSRPRCAEVLIDGEEMHLIRKRETVADLMRDEYLIGQEQVIS
ncbi:MAG: diaminopimelate decarboxylase [Gammaproteobacteria bacterium]|nr:diaminopimelate decarboxylase [Gammaproteobacteria bacterium]